MGRRRIAMALTLVGLLALAIRVDAGPKKNQPVVNTPAPAAVASDNYDELFLRYLEAARKPVTTSGPNIGWMTGLGADFRARQVNDLVTVQVVESIVGSGSADSSLDKKGSGTASVTNLAGLENKLPSWLDPTNLVGASHSTDFKGGGATTRSSTLTAMMTARVTEVLPNGDLVLEGIREVDINGDRQFIVLSGIVRAADIGPGNVVASTAVGQMQIRYFGKGLIKDNLKPGWLIRALNKVF